MELLLPPAPSGGEFQKDQFFAAEEIKVFEDGFVEHHFKHIKYMIITILSLIAITRSCTEGLYFNSSLAQCLPCDSVCSACREDGTCSNCSLGYYLQGEACLTCQVACRTCVAIPYCTSCNSGFYFINSSSSCQLCSSNCLSCSSNSDCLKCNSGLYPEAGVCVACKLSCECSDGTLRDCPSNFLQNSGVLLAIILAPIIGLFSFILIACLVRKRLCKNQNQPDRKDNASDSQFSSDGFKLIGAMLSMKKRCWTVSETDQAIDRFQACSICLQGEADLSTNCNHLFHMKCLCTWLKTSKTCPMCKSICIKQLRKYCRTCFKHYISCNLGNIFKYNVSFFETCCLCQSRERTLTSESLTN